MTAPPSLTREATEALFARTAHLYLDVPGLIRKYFGYSGDGAAIVVPQVVESAEARVITDPA